MSKKNSSESTGGGNGRGNNNSNPVRGVVKKSHIRKQNSNFPKFISSPPPPKPKKQEPK